MCNNEETREGLYSHKKDLARLCITLPSGDCAIIQLKNEEMVPVNRDTSVIRVKRWQSLPQRPLWLFKMFFSSSIICSLFLKTCIYSLFLYVTGYLIFCYKLKYATKTSFILKTWITEETFFDTTSLKTELFLHLPMMTEQLTHMEEMVHITVDLLKKAVWESCFLITTFLTRGRKMKCLYYYRREYKQVKQQPQ